MTAIPIEVGFQLDDDEAKYLAGEVIINAFRKFMHDLNSTEAVNDTPDLDEMAFDLGIKELTEGDLQKVDKAVNDAIVTVAVAW